MSNDKPCAIATVKFYANKHVEVELSTIRNITPRTLDIASHIMLKTYRGMKHAFLAEEHKRVRKEKAEAEAKAIEDDAAWHEAEDKRLQAVPIEKAAPAVKEVSEDVMPKEKEAPEESEDESEDDAENDTEESKDKPEVV